MSEQTQDEIREDFYQDMLRDQHEESRRDTAEEKLLRTDWEAMLEHLDLTEDSTLSELVDAVRVCNSEYGWNIDECSLMKEAI